MSADVLALLDHHLLDLAGTYGDPERDGPDPIRRATHRSRTRALPDRTAKALLWRLQSEQPGAFADGLLRTMQRRVREWRVAAAKNLVFGGGLGADTAGDREHEINAIAAGLSGAISMRHSGSVPS